MERMLTSLVCLICVLATVRHCEGCCTTFLGTDDEPCSDSQMLEVIYSTGSPITCPPIQKMKSDDVPSGTPMVKYTTTDDNTRYLLLMVDPEATNPCRYWLHWLVNNIKGSDLKEGTNAGQVLTDYNPPTPPSGTGYHRYQFLLFEKPQGPVQPPSDRCGFDVHRFMNNLNLGSCPLAAFEYEVKH